MNYTIIFAPEAVPEFKALPVDVQVAVKHAIADQLTTDPRSEDGYTMWASSGVRSLICRMENGQASLCYDVMGDSVEILAVNWMEFLHDIKTWRIFGITFVTGRDKPKIPSPQELFEQLLESSSQSMKRLEAARWSLRQGLGVKFEEGSVKTLMKTYEN